MSLLTNHDPSKICLVSFFCEEGMPSSMFLLRGRLTTFLDFVTKYHFLKFISSFLQVGAFGIIMYSISSFQAINLRYEL